MMSAVSPPRPAVFQSSKPLVFAHRGGAARGPENTLAACERGVAFGADGLECDVHLSHDGIPVVIHDETLERTTNLTGPVSARTADEPTLEQLLRRFPDTRVIVEAKQGGARLARAIAVTIAYTGASDRVCVGSFDHVTLAAFRAAAPHVATSASEPEARWTLYRSWVRWPIRSFAPHVAFQVPEHAGRLRVISPGFVRQVHREGRVVQVWVVDAEDDVRRLLDWGVDGIISDLPDVAVQVRDAWYAAGRGEGL
jgi:glycerophosphoryl diester phosphodiesterase